MKPRLRPWPLRLLQVIREAFIEEPKPRVVRNSISRVRRLQKRAAQQAHRNPFIQPQRQSRQIDGGFQ